jgi:phosphoglycolate phosphatase-like HAD superfamily hydrolase
MKVLALDFDGVICDSAREVFQVGLRAYTQLQPDSRLAASAEGESRDAIRHDFVQLTPLGNRAEDFGVALRAIDEGIEIRDQAGYDAYFASQDSAWLQAFHAEFYRQRIALREAGLDAWLRLHASYEPFDSALARLAHRLQLAVVTAKDRGSVRLLLEAFGIAGLFGTDLILDKEVGVAKTEHMRVLAERLDLSFVEITFVDDKVNHLQAVATLGVRVVLAGWGFNTEREHELARTLGIPIASLDDVEQVLGAGSVR